MKTAQTWKISGT